MSEEDDGRVKAAIDRLELEDSDHHPADVIDALRDTLNDYEGLIRRLYEAIEGVECAHPRKVIDQYDDAGDEFHYEPCGQCGSCRARVLARYT